MQRLSLISGYQWQHLQGSHYIQKPLCQGTNLANQRGRPQWVTSYTHSFSWTLLVCVPCNCVSSGQRERDDRTRVLCSRCKTSYLELCKVTHSAEIKTCFMWMWYGYQQASFFSSHCALNSDIGLISIHRIPSARWILGLELRWMRSSSAGVVSQGAHGPQWRCHLGQYTKQTVISPLSGAPQTRATGQRHRLTEEPSEMAKCFRASLSSGLVRFSPSVLTRGSLWLRVASVAGVWQAGVGRPTPTLLVSRDALFLWRDQEIETISNDLSECQPWRSFQRGFSPIPLIWRSWDPKKGRSSLWGPVK